MYLSMVIAKRVQDVSWPKLSNGPKNMQRVCSVANHLAIFEPKIA